MTKPKVEQILDGASSVVFQQGIAKLTIDGVAKEVGMSKGGVLYHFPTKESLIEGMVQRVADQWGSGFRSAYQNEPEGPGRTTKALMRCAIKSTSDWNDKIKETSSAVFAALAFDPKLIQPMRDLYKEMHEKLDADGLPPGVAQVVMASIDGMWLWWVLGLRTLDDPLVDSMRNALEQLVESTETDQ